MFRICPSIPISAASIFHSVKKAFLCRCLCSCIACSLASLAPAESFWPVKWPENGYDGFNNDT